MRLILSGGGTGGHIYPALAIAEGVKRVLPTTEILYIGTEKGLESNIVPKAGYNFATINIAGLDRTSMLKASQALMKVPKGFLEAREIIKNFKPDVVVGTGGYVSFPVLYSATFFACKTIIHEQNAIAGLANRHLAKKVDYTLLTFPEAKATMKAKRPILTGLPVRPEILNIKRHTAKSKLGLDDNFTLLAFGGSRGAASINRSMIYLIDRYRNDNKLQIIWITGENNYEGIHESLEAKIGHDNIKCKLLLYPYMYNIEEALAAADLAICRAGASTVAELTILGLPAILIPYPYAAENHQEKNARALMDKNAAEMVIDEFLDGDTLYRKVNYLLSNEAVLKNMKNNLLKEARPDALERIVEIITN
ncbi:MAG: undecaprenyldiphospho-muramoylpentapeptide beta-N-acetylglucosaminyltransferase [Syntrophomonadaceae bacterium]|nr:undecaprenyldiphospho-muramoylpentapeptide beta-N-acetylglucosaminyltransferase [Syntrophomonadaceae bacterium]